MSKTLIQYTEELLNSELDNVEIYKNIFGNQVSVDHARKCISTLERFIELSKSFQSTEDNTYNKNTLEIHKDGSQTSEKLLRISEEQCKDEDFLLIAHGYNTKLWELISAKNTIWTHGFSSKITVKPKINSISIEEISEHFEEFSKRYKSQTIIKSNYTYGDKMLEIPIMDLHLGKLGWSQEVGENFDYKIAEKRFLEVINDIINRTEHYNFEKIIFPIGNDFFNYDTIIGTTTAGTRQDNDLRWQKLFLKGVELLVQAIDLLSLKAPVEVFYVAGNHDKSISYYATNYLYAWFRNNENVTVVTDPKVRKYIEYGNNLIGFSHGSEEKKRIAGIMQVEAKEAWGRTKYREWHLSHLHSEHTKEENGIIIRKISSITGTDAWHYESGYVGAVKKAQAFVWDRENGLTDILNSIV